MVVFSIERALKNKMFEKGSSLKIGATVEFTVGLIGFLSYILTLYGPSKGFYPLNAIFGKQIVWFGGVQRYSFSHFLNSCPAAADLLAVNYPLYSLGSHLCGVGGFLYIADALKKKRAWALFALFCIIVIAGVNDTYGAYFYYLKSGEYGFLLSLIATSLGFLALLFFLDCLQVKQESIRINTSQISGRMYLVGRSLAISSTFTIMVLWMYGYFSYFLPSYLLYPTQPANFFGNILPSLHQQLAITDPSVTEYELKSTYFYGFSVMTAQMAWAAGSVGFGICPFIAAVYGLVDKERFLRTRCIMFLLYVAVCSFLPFYFRIDPITAVGGLAAVHIHIVLALYSFLLLVACGLLTISHPKLLFTTKKLD